MQDINQSNIYDYLVAASSFGPEGNYTVFAQGTGNFYYY